MIFVLKLEKIGIGISEVIDSMLEGKKSKTGIAYKLKYLSSIDNEKYKSVCSELGIEDSFIKENVDNLDLLNILNDGKELDENSYSMYTGYYDLRKTKFKDLLPEIKKGSVKVLLNNLIEDGTDVNYNLQNQSRYESEFDVNDLKKIAVVKLIIENSKFNNDEKNSFSTCLKELAKEKYIITPVTFDNLEFESSLIEQKNIQDILQEFENQVEENEIEEVKCGIEELEKELEEKGECYE